MASSDAEWPGERPDGPDPLAERRAHLDDAGGTVVVARRCRGGRRCYHRPADDGTAACGTTAGAGGWRERDAARQLLAFQPCKYCWTDLTAADCGGKALSPRGDDPRHLVPSDECAAMRCLSRAGWGVDAIAALFERQGTTVRRHLGDCYHGPRGESETDGGRADD